MRKRVTHIKPGHQVELLRSLRFIPAGIYRYEYHADSILHLSIGRTFFGITSRLARAFSATKLSPLRSNNLEARIKQSSSEFAKFPRALRSPIYIDYRDLIN